MTRRLLWLLVVAVASVGLLPVIRRWLRTSHTQVHHISATRP